jgi:glucan phosphoethanolaminetransferase (alkaline phosphatase superfamily)
MAFLALSIPLILLFIIVEIAAIALHMTGLSMNSARFQALSAFTSTGFTTHESEDVVSHKQRRQIIMTLMVVGFVTWASLVSLFINAVMTKHELLPSLIQFSGLLLILIILIFLARYRPFVKGFRKRISEYLENKTSLKSRSFDEILRLSQDYGIAEVTLTKDSPNIGLKIKETNFRDNDILILAIEREDKVIPAPKATDALQENDVLICYGKLKKAKESAEDES